MPQISLLSLDNDNKYYEWKKLKKACKKVNSIAGWMFSKTFMSAEDCKAFWKDLFAICDQVKQKCPLQRPLLAPRKDPFERDPFEWFCCWIKIIVGCTRSSVIWRCPWWIMET